MKKILRLVLLIALCSCGGKKDSTNVEKILENVCTLELSFGDKDLPDEFLLAQPWQFKVNDAGDVYVFDEYKIKVFDKKGKPKVIFGGRGQGPGEFESMGSRLFISPEGWLSVFGMSSMSSWSVFSPSNKFISKNVFSSSVVFNTLKSDYKISISTEVAEQNIYVLNDKEFIVKGTTATYDNFNEAGEYYDYIIYINRDKISAIAKYRNVDTFIYKIGSGYYVSGTVLGSLSIEILPGSKIIYTHTYHDVKYINDTAYLTFHVFSLADNIKKDFVFPYKPVVIADSTLKKYEPSYQEKMRNERPRKSEIPQYVINDAQKKIDAKVYDFLKQMKYHNLFAYMQSDGVYLFLMLSGPSTKTIKVINSETGKEVSNFIYPESLYMYQYKNGYGYKLYTPKDGYPVVEKYRINPAVYGK